ncbi:uncharacterized protein TOL2_C33090 [Desulfobacula toluolica Tol2]|uniref:Uncharacterized protein n=1 Tax=Desulfobacula toluolica (strain DSM 7467 / Tol2) TaxID=651182 RepID=K0NJ20_DESTT|nr:uncharacterized protein TOL2_C33090 [Desulfobacula toluolica Tol2]
MGDLIKGNTVHIKDNRIFAGKHAGTNPPENNIIIASYSGIDHHIGDHVCNSLDIYDIGILKIRFGKCRDGRRDIPDIFFSFVCRNGDGLKPVLFFLSMANAGNSQQYQANGQTLLDLCAY